MKKPKYTGERYIPGGTAVNVREDHLRRYRHIVAETAGKKVLDAACGIGYGSEMLAETAAKVVGIDLSLVALVYGRENYAADNLYWVKADAQNLPFPERSFEVVVSFETIEHLSRPEKFLAEIRRVLTPGGLAVISTPVKKSESLDKFHRFEFTPAEFIQLISNYFTVERVMGQRWMWTPFFRLFCLESVNRWQKFWPVKKLYRRLYGKDEIRPYSGKGWFTPNFLVVWGRKHEG